MSIIRTQIAKFIGTTQNVEATIDYVMKRNKVIRLKHVKVNNEVCDHIWVRCKKELSCDFRFNKTQMGSKVTFTAKIDTYYKTDKNGQRVMNYCLVDINGLQLI